MRNKRNIGLCVDMFMIASLCHINNNSFQYFIADTVEGDGDSCSSEFIYF